MARSLDRILVVDVEATCWPGEPPAGQQAEIIEIGLCVLNVASCQRLEKRSILVRPERSRVSQYCTELTTLTQADVDRGVSLDEACQILIHQYRSQERLWASYGDYDRRQFERDCGARGISYPFGPSHLNVKTLLAVVEGWPQEVGLAQAMTLLGIERVGTLHRGIDDAWNIAGVLAALLLRSRRPGSHKAEAAQRRSGSYGL